MNLSYSILDVLLSETTLNLGVYQLKVDLKIKSGNMRYTSSLILKDKQTKNQFKFSATEEGANQAFETMVRLQEGVEILEKESQTV